MYKVVSDMIGSLFFDCSRVYYVYCIAW